MLVILHKLLQGEENRRYFLIRFCSQTHGRDIQMYEDDRFDAKYPPSLWTSKH